MTMLLSLYKSQSKTLIFNFQSLTHYFLQRSYGTKRKIISTTDSIAFRTSFLENQCGLSGKYLIRPSNLVNFEPSDQRPISVLNLFQTFGFSQLNITKIISTYPQILHCFTQNNLKPKLDFLVSITRSRKEVVRIITKYPRILQSSLNNHLIPSFNLLKSVTGGYENAVSLIKSKPSVMYRSISKRFLPNMEFLLTIGVPHSQILKLLTYAHVLGCQHDQLCKIMMKLKEMGFDFLSSNFITVVQTLSFNSDSSWQARWELFRSFGFTDDEILVMFKKLPAIIAYSVKQTNDRMDFFLNKLGWSPTRLSNYPGVLAYSFQNRTIQRCSVLQALVSKVGTGRSIKLITVIRMTEEEFFNKFVTSHKDQVPEVLEAYHGKLRFDEYNFESEGKVKLKA